MFYAELCAFGIPIIYIDKQIIMVFSLIFRFKQLTCQLGELLLWRNPRLQPGET